ncbi:MAG: hypothetical protein R6U38_06985 [Desulfatiglandaceae bacterium]
MELIQWISDIVAILMCAVTVLLLIKQRAKYGPELKARGGIKDIGNFNQQLEQLVDEETNLSKRIAGREGLENPVNKAGIEVDNRGINTGTPIRETAPSRGGLQDPKQEPADDDPYGEVKKLAEMGFDKEEIFKRIGIPRGEIELVLKLNSLRDGFRGS